MWVPYVEALICLFSFRQVIFMFGFGVPLFHDVEIAHRGKWGVWFTHKLLLAAAYGYILFVHFSKWRDKLPRKSDVLFLFSYSIFPVQHLVLTYSVFHYMQHDQPFTIMSLSCLQQLLQCYLPVGLQALRLTLDFGRDKFVSNTYTLPN